MGEEKPAAKSIKNHPEERDDKGRFLPRHAAYSRQIRQRYSDKRTKEGKRLAAVLNELIQDVGPDLSAGQCLLLDRIREKLIVLMQIGAYVDRQESILNDKGEILPCLGKNYTTYAESLRRDLEALYATGKRRKPMSYEKALKAIEGGKK